MYLSGVFVFSADACQSPYQQGDHDKQKGNCTGQADDSNTKYAVFICLKPKQKKHHY